MRVTSDPAAQEGRGEGWLKVSPFRSHKASDDPDSVIMQRVSCHSLKRPPHTHTATTTLWPPTTGEDGEDREIKRGILGSVMDELEGC